jgi:hypothetical protein
VIVQDADWSYVSAFPLRHRRTAGGAGMFLPARPLWGALAIDTVAYAAALAVLGSVVTVVRGVVRRRRGRCPRCGYALRPGGLLVCPECAWCRPSGATRRHGTGGDQLDLRRS